MRAAINSKIATLGTAPPAGPRPSKFCQNEAKFANEMKSTDVLTAGDLHGPNSRAEILT
jgi:hypothetical protein